MHCQSLLLFVGLITLSVAAADTRGAIISKDWKQPGDGLLTVNIDNGLEYLDLSLTNLAGFPGTLVEDRYQAVIAQTVQGGLFEGFMVSNRNQATSLLNSAGIVADTSDFATNGLPTSTLISFLSATEVSGNDLLAHALIDEVLQRNTLRNRTVVSLGYRPQAGLSGVAYGRLQFGPEIVIQTYPDLDATYAVLLVRSSVPEPASSTLLLCVLFIRLRKRM